MAKIRDWRQKFDPKAKYVWRVSKKWDSATPSVIGSPFPDDEKSRRKLRRVWELGWIEHAEAPNAPKPKTESKPKAKPPKVEKPAAKKDDEGPTVESVPGGRFKITHNGESQVVRGKEARDEYLADLKGSGA